MYLGEAMKTNKPFRHPDIIGAYCWIAGEIIHRDNIYDYMDIYWLYENVLTNTADKNIDDDRTFTLGDLIRDDWYIIEFETIKEEPEWAHPNYWSD